VFENRVLRITFGPKRDKGTGEWSNKGLNDLYCSPNITRMIKSRRMKWARHVTRVEHMRDAYRACVGKPDEKRPLG
jgi:hypothetical protein